MKRFLGALALVAFAATGCATASADTGVSGGQGVDDPPPAILVFAEGDPDPFG